ncbi:hypothetical protein IV38_GL001853 [Lactobacillus selangorensis]|uniref:Uncharacterized protein n=1 Tax=Lactobacillus selangorensis TaxID=81857 RepID=A0A0R2FSD6_9LACO|nr:hypothetical protein [Lactobacillus selangorensis]KRN28012.1 hypothetical protein IV38_GL001853 [Lactobacillus selangorensis]KRN30517.1 hypothetical protein IV40_GL001702 [Lactobacillus selangorensis]
MDLYDIFRVFTANDQAPKADANYFSISTDSKRDPLNLTNADLVNVMYTYFNKPDSPSNIDDYEISPEELDQLNSNLSKSYTVMEIVSDLSREVQKFNVDFPNQKIEIKVF